MSSEYYKSSNNAPLWPSEPEIGGWYTDQEYAAALQAMRDVMDWRDSKAKEYIERFETEFAKYIGTSHAIAINGAGTGLDMAWTALDLQPDDEVISCAINFPGTHLSVIGKGAKLILSEPNPETLNIDPGDIEHRCTDKTRAILVTHMNGLGANLQPLLDIAERNPHPHFGPPRIISDASRACGASIHGIKIGKPGWLTVFSFQRKKTITTLGEGGMITTDCSKTAEALRRIRSFGAGIGWGTNYKMTDVQAAVGLVQLARLSEIIDRRMVVAHQRTSLLKGRSPLILPYEIDGYVNVYSYYNLQVPMSCTRSKRDELIRVLHEKYRIGCAVANPPTYQSNQLIRRWTQERSLPIAEELGNRLFCPSIHPLMTEEDNTYIADSIIKAYEELN